MRRRGIRATSGGGGGWLVAASLVLGGWPGTSAGGAEPEPAVRFTVPAGFVVERVASAPLVKYPMLAGLDDRGRLFIAEGTGTNLPGTELEKLKLGRIVMLEDVDGDGRFDKSTVFADKLIFPTGALPRDGSVFAASHPSLWRLEDTDGDGVADRRAEVVTGFNFNGNGCDIHGPFPGPDGFLYWTDGRHGYSVKTREGATLEGLAARVWRCHPDGSEIERLAGGGFDNPVELVFTEEGDLIGTMDQAPGDALLHYVEGGVYPMDHPSVKEFPTTGPMLGAVAQFSAALPVALCGLARYRSDHFGPDYKDTLFTAQFNVHRVQQHVLVRDGSTFRGENRDFLTSTDYDFHPTDVLEDADGSLLVVDMGAWFNYGCPTSKIAKPEVFGAVYRVRRADSARPDDPWGLALALDTMGPDDLAARLDDPRPKVRDRVVGRLVALGAGAVPATSARLGPPGAGLASPLARRNALWALGRIGTPEARRAVRGALGDADAGLRQVAAHLAGVVRDLDAVPALEDLVVRDRPPVRLKAAEALGRIGRAGAVPALLAGVRKGDADRFLEHALIYALIRINDSDATRVALDDTNPRVRRAGLIALDQMADRRLTREEVLPLLDTDDPELQQAALAVVSREGTWSAELGVRLKEWLSGVPLDPGKERSLAGALLALGSNADVQALVAERLSDPATPPVRRRLLLEVVTRSRVEHLPASWLAALGRALEPGDASVRADAVAAIRTRGLADFDDRLARLAEEAGATAELRVAALDALAPRHRPLPSGAFALLLDHLGGDAGPLVQVAAARAMGGAALDEAQLKRLAARVADAGPLLVPLLLPAFARSSDAATGLGLVEGLKASPGTGAVLGEDLAKLLDGYPAEVRGAARPILDGIAARQLRQAEHLGRLTASLAATQGDPERGRQVFYSKKVGCFGCHQVDGRGGAVGPDLSQIGRVRTTRDLLEAVAFPSSTVVPAYRSYVISTRDGKTTQGMIVRETPDAVFVRTADLAELRIPTREVEAMKESEASIMPQGLAESLTSQEFSDLLEFLYQRQ